MLVQHQIYWKTIFFLSSDDVYSQAVRDWLVLFRFVFQLLPTWIFWRNNDPKTDGLTWVWSNFSTTNGNCEVNPIESIAMVVKRWWINIPTPYQLN